MQRSITSLLIFFAVASLLVGGIHWYMWSRLVRAPELGQPWTRAGGWLFVALGLLMPAGLFVGRLMKGPVPKVIAALSYGWMGIAVLLFFVLIASEVVRGGVAGWAALTSTPLDAGRRTFLSRVVAGSASFVALALAGTGAASALGKIAVEKVTVPLARLPEALRGFRVVQLSDLHIGPTLGRGWLAEVVARANALDPDIVVITGDLVDGSVSDLSAEVAPLRDLRAKHGVFFVTGNHEYYSGAEEWMAELGRLGVRVLRNERVPIGEGEHVFDLAGVDDWSTRGRRGGADLSRALAGRDPARAVVLLAHQPKHILEAARLGVDLQLSGHTHGGQIFPWGLFVRIDQPYLAGLARHGDTHIYVSRGTGFWGPPMRVAAPPEISLLELTPA